MLTKVGASTTVMFVTVFVSKAAMSVVFCSISSNLAAVKRPAALVVAAGRVVSLPSLEVTSKVVAVIVSTPKLVTVLLVILDMSVVFVPTWLNKAEVITPALVPDAANKVALFPSEEFTFTVVVVVVPSDKFVLTLWFISDTFALFNSCSSNIAEVMIPPLVVFAAAIESSDPSLELIATVLGDSTTVILVVTLLTNPL